MNKYQIQVDHKTENKWNWICVYADSDQKAIQNAKVKLYDFQNPIYLQTDDYDTKYWKDHYKEKFKGYIISPYNSIFSVERDCKPPNDYDTISLSNTKENQNMAFFNVNWNDYTYDLLKIAAAEEWSNDTYPNNGRNIIFEQNYALFNTGLFTKYYEPIYAYHSEQDILFLTEYDLGKRGIVKYPDRANYFEHPELLLFDWHYKINVYYKHILEDNKSRMNIPEDILNSHNLLNTFNGAIDTMKKKVSSNYKLAIPQYFEGKVQLLLPLCLHSDDIPDLALVVTKIGDVYQGHTCLTLDMAYNNARLIAKPECNWLSANNK